MLPDVTVSIISMNNRDLLEHCLETLFEQTGPHLNMEVIVVDNVSVDDSRALVRTRFPTVRLICNTACEGFSANHNKALRLARGRYMLVLNEDTVILDRAVEKMVAFADQHSEAGLIGPKTLNPDGSLQDTCVYFPTPARYLKHILLQRYTSQCVNAYPPPTHDMPADVEWLRGSCLLVRREAMKQVGLLDDRFFLFYEETDWCYRMRQHGWRNILCPAAHIIHIGKQTVQKVAQKSIAPSAQSTLSEYLYFDKHLSRAHSLAWRAFMLLYLTLRLAKTLLPLPGMDVAQRPRHKRLLKHLLWLTTRTPAALIEIGKTLGGLPPEGNACRPRVPNAKGSC